MGVEFVSRPGALGRGRHVCFFQRELEPRTWAKPYQQFCLLVSREERLPALSYEKGCPDFSPGVVKRMGRQLLLVVHVPTWLVGAFL